MKLCVVVALRGEDTRRKGRQGAGSCRDGRESEDQPVGAAILTFPVFCKHGMEWKELF